jgi:hypothetical protein
VWTQEFKNILPDNDKVNILFLDLESGVNGEKDFFRSSESFFIRESLKSCSDCNNPLMRADLFRNGCRVMVRNGVCKKGR